MVGTTNAVLVATNEKFQQFSQEVRFQSPTDVPVTYIAGAYYAHGRLKVDAHQGFYFAPFGARSGGEYGPTTPVVGQILNWETSDVMSLFGSTTINASDRARINLGVRYTIVSKDASRTAQIGTSGLAFPTIASFVPGNATTQAALLPVVGYDAGDFTNPNRSDSKLMPTASVQYDVTPDVMTYASYAKGFKAGGYSILNSKSAFGPETVDAYEIGIKSALFDRKLTFNIAVFYSKYKDLQESTTFNIASGSATQFVANVAQSTSKGVEIGTLLRASDRLTLTADVAYLDARYGDYPGAPCTALQKVGNPTCVQNLSGKRRAFAPEFSGNVGVSYSAPIGDSYKATVDGNVYFSSSFFQQPVADPFMSQSGYAKLDARVAFGRSDGLWELAIIGKNLTNKITASYRQTIVAPGSFQALADPRRSVGLQVTYRH